MFRICPQQPAVVDRVLKAGPVLVGTAACFQVRSIDPLDIDAAVLRRLGGVGDLDQLARRGVGIGKGRGSTTFMRMISNRA